MKTLGWMALALCATACGTDDSAPGPTLDADTHFVVVPDGYASPEDCIATAQQPFSCIQSLSLCANGRAGMRLGDLVYQGEYTLDGSTASIMLSNSGQKSALRFDVAAVADLDSPSTMWIVDTANRWMTLQFDSISCAQP